MICYSSSEYQTLPPHTSNNNSKIILFASTLCQRHSIVTTKNSICQSFSTTTLQYNSHSTSNTSRSRLTITFHSFITEKCHQELIHCQSSDLLLVPVTSDVLQRRCRGWLRNLGQREDSPHRGTQHCWESWSLISTSLRVRVSVQWEADTSVRDCASIVSPELLLHTTPVNIRTHRDPSTCQH